MKLNKEDELLSAAIKSLEGIQKAEPAEGFTDKVMERISNLAPVRNIAWLSTGQFAGIMAAAVVIIALNIGFAIPLLEQMNGTAQTDETLASVTTTASVAQSPTEQLSADLFPDEDAETAE
ncbi:MAG: hypothetical protein V4543_15960 [Bacteroidota bacterium]